MPTAPKEKLTGRAPIDPMRVFTLVASAAFVAIGIMMTADGKAMGWMITALFGDELKARFPGFDYAAVIHGGTTFEKHLCWERQRATGT